MTETAHGPRTRYRWIGLGAGFLLAFVDFAALWSFQDQLGGVFGDRAFVLSGLCLFVVTFSVLGYALGQLVEARKQAAADAATIGEQLRALEASQRQVVEYEKLASLGRLAAGVAHEVRNPLAVIRSAASVLIERLPAGDDESRKAGEFIREEVDRLDGFVRALLGYARPVTVARRRVPLTEVLERARMLASPVSKEAGCAVAVEPAKRVVPLDPDLVAQAIAAVVTNACEACDADERDDAGGRVEVDARVEGDRVLLRVRDDGPGIEPEVRERLFEPFVTTRARGTGLGLPMAARVVEAHGGTLEVIDGDGLGPAGRGACFVATLPLEPPAEPTDQPTRGAA